MSDTSIAASLTQALATATAPGGILTRKSTFATSAGVLVGLAVVGFVLLGILRREPDPAAVRLNDPDLARLPTQSTVALDEQTGRRDIRRYGKLDDRDMAATLVMVMPPVGRSTPRDFDQEIGELEPLRNTNATVEGVYDFATRYGAYRAVEFSVDMDGRWKQCFAFLSRFESASIYVKGWICDAVGSRMNADRVACALDGTTFAPVPSMDADAFLAERAARQPVCAARRLPSMDRSRPRNLGRW
jgi:hypothetical protein